MVLENLRGCDKIELLRFYSEFMELVELSKREALSFAKAEVGDQDRFLLYDETKETLDGDMKRYPIVSMCVLVPDHSHDIVTYWNSDAFSSFSGLNICIVFDESDIELNGNLGVRHWHIEVCADSDPEREEIICIDNGSFCFP